jgi:hypothetical protein
MMMKDARPRCRQTEGRYKGAGDRVSDWYSRASEGERKGKDTARRKVVEKKKGREGKVREDKEGKMRETKTRTFIVSYSTGRSPHFFDSFPFFELDPCDDDECP